VHEQEDSNGGCPFGTFFDNTPQDLIDSPYELFKDMAIALYETTEYRDFGLILVKLLPFKMDLNRKFNTVFY
jgi:hypothetical protein